MKRSVIVSKNVPPASCPDVTLAQSERLVEDATKTVFPAPVACLISLRTLC